MYSTILERSTIIFLANSRPLFLVHLFPTAHIYFAVFFFTKKFCFLSDNLSIWVQVKLICKLKWKWTAKPKKTKVDVCHKMMTFNLSTVLLSVNYWTCHTLYVINNSDVATSIRRLGENNVFPYITNLFTSKRDS